MSRSAKRKVVSVILLALCVGSGLFVVRARAASSSAVQNEIDANTAQIEQLNKQIAQYEAKLKEIGADKKTLQQAIDALELKRKTVETRIESTQHTINTTQLEIDQLDASIASSTEQLADQELVLAKDLRALQQRDAQPFIVTLLSSHDIGEVWEDAAAFEQINSAVHDSIASLRAQKAMLASAQQAAKVHRATLAGERDSLRSQQTSLTQTKRSKDQLLAETNSKESNYEELLTNAKKVLASFTAFARNAGGSGLLANQTSCDAWGCYYNQRDSAWGNKALNGTEYALKSDGCLVTAMAMVMTHYGFKDVTPATINADPNNFAAYYPAFLLNTIQVDGKTASRIAASIDATLAGGDPVVVGLHAYGGTHFVVLVSGSGGNYLMRDPYLANGKDISFSAHYSMGEIYEINKVVIS